MRVLVTGAAGQLGGSVARAFGAHHDVVPATRLLLDLTDHERVLAFVESVRPQVIVNCAAYNAVDQAEDDAAGALAVNAFAVRTLARAAVTFGASLVHFSTDFVFDGVATAPYTEEDAPNPASVYGQSKLLGEWFARDAGRHFVLRVESLFGGNPARSSADKIIAAVAEGRPVRVFVDRLVTPSYVEDVAAATLALVERGAPSGLYHCVNTGVTTWHDLAVEVGAALGRTPTLEPVRFAEVPLRAPRPRYCALSNRKLLNEGIEMPTWQDALRRSLGVTR